MGGGGGDASHRRHRGTSVGRVALPAVHGRPGGDSCRHRPGRDLHGHCRTPRARHLDRFPRGGPQWRTGALPRLQSPSASHPLCPAAQGRQARHSPLAAGDRRGMAHRAVVARADLSPVAPRAPRRSDDVGEPRDDLPVAVRPGQGGFEAGARQVSPHRPGAAPTAVSHRAAGCIRAW